MHRWIAVSHAVRPPLCCFLPACLQPQGPASLAAGKGVYMQRTPVPEFENIRRGLSAALVRRQYSMDAHRIGQEEMARVVGETWKALSPAEKEPYEKARAPAARARMHACMPGAFVVCPALIPRIADMALCCAYDLHACWRRRHLHRPPFS